MPGWSHLEDRDTKWPWFTRVLASLGFGKRLAYLEMLATVDEDLRFQQSINQRRLRDRLSIQRRGTLEMPGINKPLLLEQLRDRGTYDYLEEQVVRYEELEDNDWYTLEELDL